MGVNGIGNFDATNFLWFVAPLPEFFECCFIHEGRRCGVARVALDFDLDISARRRLVVR